MIMSTTPSLSTDELFMSQALRLAARGLYTTDPNPRVGCVIVKDGQILGEGWHQRAGEPHAEIFALRQAGERSRGATLYVTLEPCSHYGRTPPCMEAVVAAGITRVVAAMADPNPLVAGKGLQRLREAGIEVTCGIYEAEARALNQGFVSRMVRGRPWVCCKLAMSLDGRTALSSGISKWITGAQARDDVQALRARCSAIVTGIGTILEDDPSLNVRVIDSPANQNDRLPRQPLRVVLDSALRISPEARVLHVPGRVLLVCAENAIANEDLLKNPVVSLLPLPLTSKGLDLHELIVQLAKADCNEVLVEAGATLSGAFLRSGLVDELWIYVAPKVLGHLASPLFFLDSIDLMSDAPTLELIDATPFGQDIRLRYRTQVVSA